jgi:hypothetical protein
MLLLRVPWTGKMQEYNSKSQIKRPVSDHRSQGLSSLCVPTTMFFLFFIFYMFELSTMFLSSERSLDEVKVRGVVPNVVFHCFGVLRGCHVER